MNGLTVKGKKLIRDIISTVCVVGVLICILFAPIISLSKTEDFFGKEIKISANINLIQWIRGGEVDIYLEGDGSSSEKEKIGTIDIKKDLQNIELAFYDKDLNENIKEYEISNFRTYRDFSNAISIIFGLAIIIICVIVEILTAFTYSPQKMEDRVAKMLGNKLGNDAFLDQIKNKTAKNHFLKTVFNVGPSHLNYNVLCLVELVIVYVYVSFVMNKFYPIESLDYSVSKIVYLLAAISLIASIFDSILSKSIEKEVEAKNIYNPNMIKSMPYFGTWSVSDFKEEDVVDNTCTVTVSSNSSANNATDNAKSIQEYKKLLDEGAITQEEYDELKKEILFKK